jgi:hypothetical protein
MIQSPTLPSPILSSPTLSSLHRAPVLPLQPRMVQRRRALRVAPPAGWMVALPADGFVEADDEGRGWKDDLSFFLACYAAAMLFFLVMLS